MAERDLSARVAKLAELLGTDEDHVLGRAVELGVAVLEGALAEPEATEIIVSIVDAAVTGSIGRTRPLVLKPKRRRR